MNIFNSFQKRVSSLKIYKADDSSHYIMLQKFNISILFIRKYVFIALTFVTVLVAPVSAHHYKGLPHYSYFENYPQVPADEFLGQAGKFEFSLVIYDFQGLNQEDKFMPDDARIFLIIFNLKEGLVYNGPVLLEFYDGNKKIGEVPLHETEEENLYRTNMELPKQGNYSLHVSLLSEQTTINGKPQKAIIPFEVTSQKKSWAKWIAGILLFLIVVAGVGARKKRIAMDRKSNIQTK